MTAWVSTSASEWTLEAELVGNLDPAQDQPPARREPMAVVSDPDPCGRGAHPSGSRCRLRSSKTQISSIPSERMNATASP